MLKLIWLKFYIDKLYFFRWLTELKLQRVMAKTERLRVRNEELREQIIRNGGARWLVEFEDACSKLDEELSRVA